MTALPATAHVEEVLTSDGGIFKSANEGTVICDVSTIKPSASAKFYEQAKKYNMTFLDTPMSGGVTGAERGTLTFMVGGTEQEFELSKNVLKGMGTNFFHCGKPGMGEVAKLTNNLILGISMVASCEGMAIGEKLGIDPKKLQQILAVSTGRNWCIDTYNPRPGNMEGVPASRQYENGFAVSLIKKDMILAMESAHEVDAKTDMLEKSLSYYVDLERKGKGTKDFGIAYQYIMKNYEI